MAGDEEDKKLTIIMTKGTLDYAYIPFILASTAAAFDMKVTIFFTFYGLNIIHKKKQKSLKVAPIANPAMPMPVPNIIGMLPGMTAMATMMMKDMMKNKGGVVLEDLMEVCKEMEVKFIACQMTMDVFGYEQEDLMDGVEFGGAATYFNEAMDADMNLFI